MPPDKDDTYIELLRKRVITQLATKPLPPHLQRYVSLPSQKQAPAAEDDRGIKFPNLDEDPEAQQALAYFAQYTPTKWLLEEEARLIADRRDLHEPERKTPRFDRKSNEDIYDWARKHRLTGLCFSGGGIRSATFNLGILQGLAVKGWLDQVDYLSSVSGGGYIHSWLVAWLKRETTEQEKHVAEPELAAWRQVMSRLFPLPHREPGQPFQAVWPSQIQWLRRYSNYLTPHKGALTGDTWAAIASWIRNVSVNQGLLISIFLAVLCVPHLFAPCVHLRPYQASAATNSSVVSSVTTGEAKTTLTLDLGPAQPPQITDGLAAKPTKTFGQVFYRYVHWEGFAGGVRISLWSIGAFLFFLVASVSAGSLLRLEYSGSLPWNEDELPCRRGDSWGAKFRRWQVVWANVLIVAPLLLFGLCLTHVSLSDPSTTAFTLALFCLLIGLVWTETFSGGALSETVRLEQERRKACSPETAGQNGWKPSFWWRAGWAALLALLGVPAAVAGALVGVLIAVGVNSVWTRDIARWLLLDHSTSVQVVLGTLLFFWLPPLTMVLASGMIGKNFPGWLGEWLARIRGYTLLAGIGWIFLFGCSLLAPGAARHLWQSAWIKWPAILTWAGTTLSGVLAGKSGKTSGDQNGASGPLEWLVVVAPYVYIAGLAISLAWLLEWGSRLIPSKTFPLGELGVWIALIVLFTGFAALLGCRLDINEFSMHSFYRNRLTRCYLGASNKKRNPSPITGFDERDSNDLSINTLMASCGYPGPIPIFCCTMNITTGEDLAWQERKAASFAFAPLYSGYTVGWTQWRKNLKFNGFVPTSMIYPGGPNVATAVAASGAALSPNWGYHTKPATAFLMTMFDVRLGLWVPNPRRSSAAGQPATAATGDVPPASPGFAPFRLLSELLGSVDDTSKYVYLTDGGHFDNMGLYELVRRRCYHIVICDAEEDGTYIYEGIGMAIRKCRIDFGVAIDLDLSGLTPNMKSKLSPAHIVRGTIRYPETLPGDEGEVIYIKASLTCRTPKDGSPPPLKGSVELPDVPGDVQNYKLQNQDFPHDSTAEQWFTESQFESYRRLGQSVVERIDRLFIGAGRAG
jgi:predicted acylesterase/phospholipase RssA